jgi:V8-like Glu-specific endopeptidase
MLADMYWDKNLARAKAVQAGLNASLIAITDHPTVTWYNILDQARLRNKVGTVIDVALQDNPDNDLLLLAKANALTAVRGPDIATKVQWQGEQAPENLEKIMGQQSTLLPISWLDAGLARAKSVVRVVLKSGELGSGFITDNGLLVTNHHVITDKAQAAEAVIQFNYQKSLQGLDLPAQEFRLAPDDKDFATSEEHDWTAVRVAGDWKAKCGCEGLELASADPKKEDYVIIIQHPGGGPKQIALYHNVIAYADNTRIQYLTDTQPGSSGSPVFNTDWQVVALHHSGGWLREPATKLQVYRNEGIHINVVIEGLKGHSLYAG